MMEENKMLHEEIIKTTNYYDFSTKTANLNNLKYDRLTNIWTQSVTIIKKIIVLIFINNFRIMKNLLLYMEVE